MATETTKIRPAGRLIATIGENLIGDIYAALVELVKNAYDADASKIDIVFRYSNANGVNKLTIDIEDDGHGMSKDIVLNAWLVPATNNKLTKEVSPNGRLLQGRKGIGRYAAAILGQELILRTVDKNGIETEVLVNWSEIEDAEYLEDVEIVVATTETKKNHGTALHIIAVEQKYDQWTKSEIDALTNELRKLKSPFSDDSDNFIINLSFIDSPYPTYNDRIFEIEAFPIIEMYDYRVFGNISAEGKIEATYENNSEPNLPNGFIDFNIHLTERQSYCGPIEFDFRVFDRDPEAIDNLIDKGLVDPISKLAIGRRAAKALLDEVYGVNLYREGFRIRPYGNGGIDWLDLDKERIQNPSVKISNNQIVGFVNIKPERISNLEEKSARDGLKENAHYFGLKAQLKAALAELEERRFKYREHTGKGGRAKNVNKALETLFDYTALTSEINKKLKHLNIGSDVINSVASVIHKDAEKKSKLLENIQNTIAIYQGQATLGKIVTVLLHEGRKPVNFLKKESPNLVRWLGHYKAEGRWESDLYDDILEGLKLFKDQSDFLADLFRRLDPLAKQNRGAKVEFKLINAIKKSQKIFQHQLEEKSIDFEIICSDEVSIIGWEEDLTIALTNLIENSIYWIDYSSKKNGSRIFIEVVAEAEAILLHYKDSGPGIEKDNVESGIIFEPGYSKKSDGTGLGLPIAGEAIERLNGNIIAHHSDTGAYFIIELKK